MTLKSDTLEDLPGLENFMDRIYNRIDLLAKKWKKDRSPILLTESKKLHKMAEELQKQLPGGQGPARTYYVKHRRPKLDQKYPIMNSENAERRSGANVKDEIDLYKNFHPVMDYPVSLFNLLHYLEKDRGLKLSSVVPERILEDTRDHRGKRKYRKGITLGEILKMPQAFGSLKDVLTAMNPNSEFHSSLQKTARKVIGVGKLTKIGKKITGILPSAVLTELFDKAVRYIDSNSDESARRAENSAQLFSYNIQDPGKKRMGYRFDVPAPYAASQQQMVRKREDPFHGRDRKLAQTMLPLLRANFPDNFFRKTDQQQVEFLQNAQRVDIGKPARNPTNWIDILEHYYGEKSPVQKQATAKSYTRPQRIMIWGKLSKMFARDMGLAGIKRGSKDSWSKFRTIFMRNLGAGSVSSEREILPLGVQSPRSPRGGKRRRVESPDDKELEEEQELETYGVIPSRKIKGVEDYVSIGDQIQWEQAETSKFPIMQLVQGFQRSWAKLGSLTGTQAQPGRYRPLSSSPNVEGTTRFYRSVLERKLLSGYKSLKKEHTTFVPGFTQFGQQRYTCDE